MSILIKGIDLPKDDEYIPMRIYGNGHIWVNGAYKGVAIQIPKGHGRLIDADETSTQYYQTMDELLQSTTTNMSIKALSLLCGLTLINSAPTILEAEE